MSKLGKIFLWLALVGAIAAGVAGYLLVQAHTQVKQNLADTQQKLAATSRQLATTEGELRDTKAKEQAAEQKDSDDEAKIADLTTQLTQAQKDAKTATDALQSAKDDAKAAQAKLDDLNNQLAGKSVQDYKDQIASLQKDNTDAQDQIKVLQDNYAQAQQKIQDLLVDINNENKKIEPPGVSGKVTFVDTVWNFVVLDVGLNSGVVPNGELIVYRGKTFLGKIRVTRADPNDSVAEILPDLKGNIQVGDAVLN
jgi:predicted RNase H-like nuclease (RuvC/YqgF family)